MQISALTHVTVFDPWEEYTQDDKLGIPKVSFGDLQIQMGTSGL